MKLLTETEDIPNISFFGDSSSRMSNFMVLGGLAVAGHRIAEFESRIADIRERGGIRSEFHWKEYRGGAKQKAYEELCRFGFEIINKKNAALHVMAADFRAFDHKQQRSNAGYKYKQAILAALPSPSCKVLWESTRNSYQIGHG